MNGRVSVSLVRMQPRNDSTSDSPSTFEVDSFGKDDLTDASRFSLSRIFIRSLLSGPQPFMPGHRGQSGEVERSSACKGARRMAAGRPASGGVDAELAQTDAGLGVQLFKVTVDQDIGRVRGVAAVHIAA